jgi:hypothetical protein
MKLLSDWSQLLRVVADALLASAYARTLSMAMAITMNLMNRGLLKAASHGSTS